MKFKTESERMQHPQARLINEFAWRDYFNSILSDVQCELMKKTPDELCSMLDDPELSLQRYRELPLEERYPIWIAIALAHPHLSDDVLIQAALQLNFTLDEPFWMASVIGKRSLLERIVTLTPDSVPDIMVTRGNQTFLEAARGGHLDMLDRLIEFAPDKVQDMIKGDTEYYFPFMHAASNGHLHVLERFFELTGKDNLFEKFKRLMGLPNKLETLVSVNEYGALTWAASFGQRDIMRRLISFIAPDKLDLALHFGFYFASRGLHLDRFLELVPNNEAQRLMENLSWPFADAAKQGRLDVMESLMRLSTVPIQDMIADHDYSAFTKAACYGHLDVMERLMILAPDKVPDMLAANNYSSFTSAASGRHLNVTTRLLAFPSVFAYAEMHDREYGVEYIYPFVQEYLTHLRADRTAMEDPEKAKLCFYLLRNLIRRNDAALLNDMRFLMDIPTVNALLHTALSPEQPNELFRLALSTGNQAAAALLLTIPAVRSLAEANDFYRNEARGGLDLAALARDRESSMTALTLGEQKQLARANKYYEPKIQEETPSRLMDSLREMLKNRYDANPAVFTKSDGSQVKLPLTWNAFQALGLALELKDVEKDKALKAYYQHKDHTALRYLEKPNPWMSEDAAYVNSNDARTERWSTFEDYKPFITMLFLAAKDEAIEATDGYTIKTRVDHFIDELAHIGRAHNWDQTRTKRVNGKEIKEEYDDLKGDKPSCYSGVKRRLFQSVQGHPLLKLLTQDDI